MDAVNKVPVEKTNISEWIEENEFETHVIDVLKKENLLKEKALLLLSEKDIGDLGLPKGDTLL